MSLEQELSTNNQLVREQNALLRLVLSNQGVTIPADLLSSTSVPAVTSTTATTAEEGTGETPKRERGKPSAGKTRRTAEEVAEDKAADDADAGGSTGETTETTETAPSGVTFDKLKDDVFAWLGEFAKDEDAAVEGETDAQKAAREANIHPEVTARRNALKNTLNKVVGADDARLPMVKDDQEKMTKLHNWLLNTAIPVQKEGLPKGRLVADPAPKKVAADDDELGI